MSAVMQEVMNEAIECGGDVAEFLQGAAFNAEQGSSSVVPGMLSATKMRIRSMRDAVEQLHKWSNGRHIECSANLALLNCNYAIPAGANDENILNDVGCWLEGAAASVNLAERCYSDDPRGKDVPGTLFGALTLVYMANECIAAIDRGQSNIAATVGNAR